MDKPNFLQTSPGIDFAGGFRFTQDLPMPGIVDYYIRMPSSYLACAGVLKFFIGALGDRFDISKTKCHHTAAALL